MSRSQHILLRRDRHVPLVGRLPKTKRAHLPLTAQACAAFFEQGETIRASWAALDRHLEPGRTVCSRPGSDEGCNDRHQDPLESGKGVVELIGPDVAAFCDGLIGDSPTYADLYQESIRKESDGTARTGRRATTGSARGCRTCRAPA